MITLKKIGNSRGIIIPKGLLEKYDLTDQVDLVETKEGILLKKAKKPHEGWEEAFQAAVDNGEFEQLAPDMLDDDIIEEY